MPQAVRAIEGLLGQRFQVEAEVGRGGMGPFKNYFSTVGEGVVVSV